MARNSDRKTYEIKCHISGTVCGTIEYIEGRQNKPKDEDFLDVRCDTCEAAHGTFKELEKESESRKVPHDRFIEILKQNRKRADFLREINKETTLPTRLDV